MLCNSTLVPFDVTRLLLQNQIVNRLWIASCIAKKLTSIELNIVYQYKVVKREAKACEAKRNAANEQRRKLRKGTATSASAATIPCY